MLTVLAVAIACVKLIEFLGGFHFEIDAWFVRNPEMFGAVPTGHIAPMTALNFVFLAGGLLTLPGDESRRWAGGLGALATIISTVPLVGCWYGTPLLYGGTVVPVALSTACAFLLLLCGIAIATAAGLEQRPLRMFYGDSTRALLLRAFVPLIIAAALFEVEDQSGNVSSQEQLRTNADAARCRSA